MVLPTAVPPRTGAPHWVAPVLVGASVLAATAVLALRSPEDPGSYPACPFHALTGWWCPACGSLRAVHALAHGDLATAVDRNVLLVLAVPLLTVAWLAWAAGRRRVALPAAAGWVLAGTVIAFWVLRNVPTGSWLAPT